MFRIKNRIFSGSTMDIVGRNIYVDGNKVHEAEESKLEIQILEGASVKKISSDRSVNVQGNIDGPVTATSVNCNDITGSVTAKSVNCDDVVGDIKAEGNVNCGRVSGSITANKVYSG